ncbi:methionine--tRNA ligase [Pendulispora albinea]|uniref:Methionine--tRNA ligase n=1 Tax=Pendulispora albinea TaxID=2741071 RepID=A0ABZ2LVU9_9BACT
MNRFYVTTPIYYVNDIPHVGTAYTTIVVDALRRFHLLLGDESRMLTGTDEHGLKLERQSQEEGKTPQAFVDEMAERFRQAWPVLDIETDDFIRTTEARHKQFVQDLWRRIEERGDLYEGEYEDWYCVGCESYKTEKELLPGNLCPIHNKPVERLKEKTFFFRLSRWEKPLLEFYERNPSFVEPATRRNEVISFVSSGLRDLSVSRTSFTWGIPVPGRPEHVMYVWFDALTNYLTALGREGDPLRRHWPPNGRAVHVVGKDILRFHAIYWPAFLLAAGFSEKELPSQVFAHGFLTVDGQKMSKSLRNAVDPLRLARELGADTLRYYLLRAIAFGQDGDFSHTALVERYNADLGKNLGNLLSRTLGLCVKFSDGKTPPIGELGPLERELAATAEQCFANARSAWDELAPHRALEATWALSSAANTYVDRAAPWASAKAGDTARTHTILGTLLEVLRQLSVMIWPAMPRKSDGLRAQLGLAPLAPHAGDAIWPKALAPRPAGEALALGAPLFPTIDKDAEQALLEKLAPHVRQAEAAAAAPAPQPSPEGGAGKSAEPEAASAPINYDTFLGVDLRVGYVKTCEKVPRKDKLLRLSVDLGEPGPRTIIAGLALSFKPEDLVGRKVIVVSNLEPRDFGKGLVSQGMLLATGPSEALHLATVEGDPPPGSRLK